jgi:hypothetical protein
LTATVGCPASSGGDDKNRCAADVVRVFSNRGEAGLYKLNPVDPQRESASFQPLTLSREKLVSKFAFHIQLVQLRRGALVDVYAPVGL